MPPSEVGIERYFLCNEAPHCKNCGMNLKIGNNFHCIANDVDIIPEHAGVFIDKDGESNIYELTCEHYTNPDVQPWKPNGIFQVLMSGSGRRRWVRESFIPPKVRMNLRKQYYGYSLPIVSSPKKVMFGDIFEWLTCGKCGYMPTHGVLLQGVNTVGVRFCPNCGELLDEY